MFVGVKMSEKLVSVQQQRFNYPITLGENVQIL